MFGSSAAAVSLPTRMNSSTVEKVLASSAAVVSPTCRMPSAKMKRSSSGSRRASIAANSLSSPSKLRSSALRTFLRALPVAASRSRACSSRRSASAFCASARRSLSAKMSAAVFSRPALKNSSMFSVPSPSMSIAPRDTKCFRLSTACAAQISSPVQRRRESSLPVFSFTSRVAGEPQTGQVCGIS